MSFKSLAVVEVKVNDKPYVMILPEGVTLDSALAASAAMMEYLQGQLNAALEKKKEEAAKAIEQVKEDNG